MDIVAPELEKYAEQFSRRESELLQKLVAESDRELEYIDMLSGRIVGALLQLLVRLSGARRILEIGTFTGYSAISMAEALPEGGELITCEKNRRYEQIARKYFEQCDTAGSIELRVGDAMDTLNELQGGFDLVFLDADKANYPSYYKKVKPLLRTGGLLVVDNTFWGGEVLNPQDPKSKAIDRLNRVVAGDPQMEQVMLTVRDGLLLVRKSG